MAGTVSSLQGVNGCDRPVDWKFVEVRAAETNELGIEVGEEPALHQRVLTDVDPGHEVAHVKRDLLGLREEVVGIPIECELPDALDGHQFFRDEFGGVEQVERKGILVPFLHHLYPELPLGKVPVRDRVPEIAPVEVRVAARDLQGFVPHHLVSAEWFADGRRCDARPKLAKTPRAVNVPLDYRAGRAFRNEAACIL